MSIPLRHKNSRWLTIPPAFVVLLLACLTIAAAQENKDESKRKRGDAASQKAAPQSAPQRSGQPQAQPAAQPAAQPPVQQPRGQQNQGQQAPAQGGRRFGGQPAQQDQTQQAPAQGGRQVGGQPAQQNQGQQAPAQGGRQVGGQPAQQNQGQQAPAQGGRQVGGQPAQQDQTQQAPAQGGRRFGGQPAQQDQTQQAPAQGGRRFGGQPAQQNQTQQAPAQGGRQFGGQPAQQNQGQQAPAQGGRQFGGQPAQRGGFGATGGSRAGERPADNRPGGGPRDQVVRFANGQPRTVHMANGGTVRRSEAGQVLEVRTSGGAVIRHAPSGVRHVEMVRPGGRVVVSTGRDRGYVQRPVVFASHNFVQRTYVVNGITRANVYRPMAWHGLSLNIYTPVRYYRPAYYSWAYNPWMRPISYSWGWARDPWYRYYGGYFVPYPSYASPILWLTDYLIATTLQEAYETRLSASGLPPAAYPPGGQAMLTPEVKQLIADEVRRQIDMERAESENVNAAVYNTATVPPMFADNSRHTFVVSDALLVNSGVGECALDEGDVIQTMGIPPVDSPTADAVVLASKPRDCRRGAVVAVDIQDLQEMQNHLRSTIDSGLGELQSRSGQAGLPALPAGYAGAVNTPIASQVQAEAGAAGELTQVAQDAGGAEQDVINQSAAVTDSSGGGAPATISLGQSIDDVTAIQGRPQKVVDLGNKKIYVYSDIKITFIDGQVADVQ